MKWITKERASSLKKYLQSFLSHTHTHINKLNCVLFDGVFACVLLHSLPFTLFFFSFFFVCYSYYCLFDQMSYFTVEWRQSRRGTKEKSFTRSICGVKCAIQRQVKLNLFWSMILLREWSSHTHAIDIWHTQHPLKLSARTSKSKQWLVSVCLCVFK